MSIISENSVGDVVYQLIDDIYPVHSAETGTVAISKVGGIYTSVAPYDWTVNFRDHVGGEMHSYDNALDTSYTLDSWVNMDALTWTGVNLSGFTVGSSQLRIDHEHLGVFLTTLTCTMEGSNSRWAEMEAFPARNNTVGYRYNGASFSTSASDTCTIATFNIYELDGRYQGLGDYWNVGNRMTAREASQSRTNKKHNKVSTRIIDIPIIFNDYGDSGSFDTKGWTVVNDDTNQWYMDSATTYSGGGNSIYISNDGGTSNAYTNTVANTSHFYRDITFPENMNSNALLSFYWRCDGESTFDYGRIYLAPSGTSVVAGTEINIAYDISGEINGQANYAATASTLSLGTASELKGQTKRLIFSWNNNGSAGTNPPIAIDSLRLYFYVNQYTPPLPPVDGLTEGFESGALPTGWADSNISGTANPWTYQSGGNAGNPIAAHTGSFNAFGYKASTVASAQMLSTSALDMSGWASATVDFWHTQTLWSPDQDELRIYYKTAVTDSWNYITGWTGDISAWQNDVVSLPNLTDDYYVGFEATMKYGRGVCVDDIIITGVT